MRLLELNFEKTWRGGERQTIYNMTGFKNAGVDVTLICRRNTPLEVHGKKEGFKVHSFNDIFGVIGFLITKGRRYDVLHAQTSHILTYCVFTKLFHRAKVIFTRRVDFVPHGKMTRWKYRLADKLVGVSEAVKEIVERFADKSVAVISDIAVPRSLDKAKATKLIYELGVQEGCHVIGTTAAFVPHKDPLTMVEAIRVLAAKRRDFVFLHFGSGELQTEVKEKIIEYQLQDVYLLPGFVNDVEDLFSVFEVFVMSSEEEGLGSSVLDAFMYHVPVVSTDAGGLAELIKDGRGIMCRKKAPDMIADGIDLLLNNSDLVKDVTTNAYQYVTTEHSLSRITQQYMALLK